MVGGAPVEGVVVESLDWFGSETDDSKVEDSWMGEVDVSGCKEPD